MKRQRWPNADENTSLRVVGVLKESIGPDVPCQQVAHFHDFPFFSPCSVRVSRWLRSLSSNQSPPLVPLSFAKSQLSGRWEGSQNILLPPINRVPLYDGWMTSVPPGVGDRRVTLPNILSAVSSLAAFQGRQGRLAFVLAVVVSLDSMYRPTGVV